jgi:membrane-associated phospholipid phosphatase
VCYLAATAVFLVVRGNAPYRGGLIVHLLVLGAIAAATFLARIPAWLRAWAPLLSILFLYVELPMLIRATGYGTFFDQTVISWETALFGGQPALEWARHMPSRALSEILHASYLAYYPIIASVPVLLQVQRRHREFPEAVFVLLLTFVACFVCFIAFPVAGPRYLWPGTAPDGPIRAFTLSLLSAGSSQGTAFPSSHVAVATTQCVLAWKYFGRRAGWLVAVSVGLAAGAVYGGFHYAIDVLAGAVFGGLVALAGLELFARIDGLAQANAIAPTNPASGPDPNGSSTSSSGAASM